MATAADATPNSEQQPAPRESSGVGVVTRNESVVWDARRNHHGGSF